MKFRLPLEISTREDALLYLEMFDLPPNAPANRWRKALGWEGQGSHLAAESFTQWVRGLLRGRENLGYYSALLLFAE